MCNFDNDLLNRVLMICYETTILLRSHPIIAISPIGVRHYNTNIYRAVPFLTLWLPSRQSPFRVLPFWLSLFLS